MSEPERISPEEARKKVLSRASLFVCAYEDEEKFRKNHLEGAVSYNEFRKTAGSLPPDAEIIFYCA